MRLIGMLDSPYVRRVAISLKLMGSRFRTGASSRCSAILSEFKAINPVVKAPSLVTDDGVVLMDSSLILEYAEQLAPAKSLMPADDAGHVRALRLIGLALAVNEKTVQIVYETHAAAGGKASSALAGPGAAASCCAAMARWKRKRPAGWFGGGHAQCRPTSPSRWPGALPKAVSPRW